MPEAKKSMLEGRLHKRLIAVGLNSYKDYYNYIISGKDQFELTQFYDSVTTNKTDFFREPVHFNFLNDHVLKEFVQIETDQPFRIWSSACSSGEEPYTTAMVIDNWMQNNIRFNFEIIASDISVKVLEKAALAVYPFAKSNEIPLNFRHKYLLKSKSLINRTIRMDPHIRRKVKFMRVNLMDPHYGFNDLFDLVFCRNVLIYFDRPTQEKVLRKISNQIRPGGYLFIGHSESIFDMKLPLTQIKPTIYQKL